jgi:hypothetical protein
MNYRTQADRRPGVAILITPWPLGVLFAFVLLCAAATRAQDSPSAVGTVEGNDVSVSSGGPGANAGQNNAAGVPVASGSIVTVHSGQARLMLTSGGEVDICGPAKLTLLRSGDAITLGLDFGRVRVQLPASTSLRIFTPTTIATPLDINGMPRDITVGLELDDSLCVRASGGALLLENQFSGEKLVVPQAGEFFLAQGKLVPVRRADATCECVMTDARAGALSPPLPSLGLTAPAQTSSIPDSPSASSPEADDAPAKPNVEFSTLAHPNEAHPVSPRPNLDAPTPLPDSMPTYKIVMPPLTFSASSPAPPPAPALDMVLLIRSVEVDPEWEFKGHVNAPSLDEGANAHHTPKSHHGRQPKPAGEREGFWARVKRFLSGSNS